MFPRELPRALAGFDILQRLGAGGAGEVFLARSRAGQLVAIKTIPDARLDTHGGGRRLAGARGRGVCAAPSPVHRQGSGLPGRAGLCGARLRIRARSRAGEGASILPVERDSPARPGGLAHRREDAHRPRVRASLPRRDRPADTHRPPRRIPVEHPPRLERRRENRRLRYCEGPRCLARDTVRHRQGDPRLHGPGASARRAGG